MDCEVDLTPHAKYKHRYEIARYIGIEAVEVIMKNIHRIHAAGTPEEVPAKRRAAEIERRKTVVKYRCRTLRVVTAKTPRCLLVITIHPYPGEVPDIQPE
ncbi:hypothetical protein [Pyrobaculum sp.]|uniref:hypothetical protein n=1 Tax=Pyrobaculum sp. TaxID=2004705 RepID=UPI003D124C6E